MPPRRVVSRSNAPAASNSSSTSTLQTPSVPAPVVAVKEAAEEISSGFSASVQELWKGYQRQSTFNPSHPREGRLSPPSLVDLTADEMN